VLGPSSLPFVHDPREDERFMRQALAEAERAREEGETPVGAVAVHEGRILGRGHNQVERLHDASAHAEILAMGAAATHRGDWRLHEVTLYVTLEPCAMCAGAMVLARLGRLVYGVRDPRAGACGSRLDLIQANWAGHDLPVRDGCLEADCRALLQEFFQSLRDVDGTASA
jgi:tRNA(adenine34) deaminase